MTTKTTKAEQYAIRLLFGNSIKEPVDEGWLKKLRQSETVLSQSATFNDWAAIISEMIEGTYE